MSGQRLRPWAFTIMSSIVALASLLAAAVPHARAVIADRSALVRNLDAEIAAWIAGVLFAVGGVWTFIKHVRRPHKADFNHTSVKDGYIALGVSGAMFAVGSALIGLILWARLG